MLPLVANVATISAVLLALWAYFFSSIPEEMTRQFRSEIADLSDQVVELRKEKRDIVDQISVVRSQLEKLRSERRRYLSAFLRTKLSIELAKLDEPIFGFGGVEQAAQQMATIVEYRRLLLDKHNLKVSDPRKFIEQLVSGRHDVPRQWLGWETTHPLEEADGLEVYRSYRADLAQPRATKVCGELLREALQRVDFGGVLKQDLDNIKASISTYLEEQASTASLPVVASAGTEVADLDVENTGSVILKNIQMCKEASSGLPDRVGTLFESADSAH